MSLFQALFTLTLSVDPGPFLRFSSTVLFRARQTCGFLNARCLFIVTEDAIRRAPPFLAATGSGASFSLVLSLSD